MPNWAEPMVVRVLSFVLGSGVDTVVFLTSSTDLYVEITRIEKYVASDAATN